MKIILIIAAAIFSSTTLYAHDLAPNETLAGLNCSAEYVLHEVSKRPYKMDRVFIRNSLLSGINILGFIPINSHLKSFSEGYSFNGGSTSITYELDIQKKNTILSIKININENEAVLLNPHSFKTREGFTGPIYFSDMIQIGKQQVTHVILTCLPTYN